MSFKQKMTPIPGTKRFEYTCIECGKKKESYVTGGSTLKYCSPKCNGIGRKKAFAQANKSISAHVEHIHVKPLNNIKHIEPIDLTRMEHIRAEHIRVERMNIDSRLTRNERITTASLGILLLNLAALISIFLLCHNIKAADSPENQLAINNQLCRSPQIENIRKLHIYSLAAQEMDTTYEIIRKVSFLKVENHAHIENVALHPNTKEFELSRMILTFEMLRLAQRKFQLWFEFGRD